MLVSGYNNIILLPNCTMLHYVFSGPLSLRAYVPEIKFNNTKKNYQRYSDASSFYIKVACVLAISKVLTQVSLDQSTL